MFVFGIFLSPENVHVMVIALTCWYAYCMDPAFSAIFCYISYYSPGFLVIAQVCSLMNCAEKRFCQPKAVSLFCRPVLFFAILSFLAPRRVFKGRCANINLKKYIFR